MRSEQDVNRIIDLYADTVIRICMLHLRNESDAEDIFQTVCIKYMHHDGTFENAEHEKAWLIRVTINACKDLQRSFFYSRTVSLETAYSYAQPISDEHREVLDAVLGLPLKYRQVILLHFYEEYTVPQIAKILDKNENTVYTHLNRAKKLLRKRLEESANG